MKKRLLLIIFLAIIFSSCAEEFSPIYPLRADAPKLDHDGFISSGYYLLQDDENGEWTYIDNKLFINIRRFQDVVERQRKLVWYESELKLADGQKLITRHANPEQIGRRFVYAEDFAKNIKAIFAISDDFYGFRVYQKRRPGVIIQNSKILADNTLSKPDYRLPNYDLVALYKDGSLKTYHAGEIGAEQLLADGATDTWCFGPILLSNGNIGEHVAANGFESINPRMCLGMIEPNHYLVMTVEGRSKRSHGVGLMWVAQRMKDLGCSEALNLDGGNSIKLAFMGRLINANSTKLTKNRSVTSMITLGEFD